MTGSRNRRSVVVGGAAAATGLALGLPAGAAELSPLRKVYVLVARKDGLDRAGFVRHWLDIHATMAARVPGVLGFIGSELSTGVKPGEASDFDGIAIIWYSDKTPVGETLGTPEGKAWLADGDTFISRERSTNISGFERVYRRPAAMNGAWKQIWFLTPPAGKDRAASLAALDAACRQHGATAGGLTGLALTELAPRAPGGAPASGRPSTYEAVVETWWFDRRTAEAAPGLSPLLKAVEALADPARSRRDLVLEHVAVTPKG